MEMIHFRIPNICSFLELRQVVIQISYFFKSSSVIIHIDRQSIVLFRYIDIYVIQMLIFI